jgi:hypothetical protein
MNLAPGLRAADVRSHALGSVGERWKHSYGRSHTALLDEDAADRNARLVTQPVRPPPLRRGTTLQNTSMRPVFEIKTVSYSLASG